MGILKYGKQSLYWNTTLGWGLLSQFPPFRYFSNSSALSKQTLAFEYRIYIWQVSPQLNCGDTCQIWMWFKESNMYFWHTENFAYGEINERSFSNPHPWWWPWECHKAWYYNTSQKSYINGLVQDCSNFSANALELLQSVNKPSMCYASLIAFWYHVICASSDYPYFSGLLHWHNVDLNIRNVRPDNAIPNDQKYAVKSCGYIKD